MARIAGLALIALVTTTLSVPTAVFASDDEEEAQPQVFEVREESTAVTAVSVLSPENLYVWNGPSSVTEVAVAYSAKQWIDEQLSTMVSVWKSGKRGGAATKVVPAGDGEVLFGARSGLSASRIYFGLNCSVYSVSKDGVGGRRKHVSTGYCDYGAVPMPETGKILFSSCSEGKDCFWKDSNYIWTANNDGSELIQLRQGAAPAPSPDGSRVAFVYQGDIWVMNIDGTNVTNITQSGEYRDAGPQFSPDGRRLVFTRQQVKERGLGNRDIWMVNTNGTNMIQLTQNRASDWGPHWAEDEFIYFVSNRGPLVGGKLPLRVWRMKPVE